MRKPARLLDPRQDTSMVIYAFRYALGRTSTSTSTCADWLVANWSKIPDNARTIIARDLEDEFARDDEARLRERETGKRDPHKALGDDCDRSNWSRVRAMYRTPKCCMCGKDCTDDVPHCRHTDGERSCRDCAPFECDRCGKDFETLENFTVDPVTRRRRHVKKCGDTSP